MGRNIDIWIKIKKEYESTETSFAKLSKTFGYSKTWIGEKSKKEGWIKFKYIKKKIEKEAREEFILESKISIKELMVKEDSTLEKFQEVVDGKIPYEEIFRHIENLSGNLIIKIDGTVKGLVETTMMIGDKRRELRGVLSLKDRKIIAIKEEELKHKKHMDRIKIQMDKGKSDIEIKRQKLDIKSKGIDYKLKEKRALIYLDEE